MVPDSVRRRIPIQKRLVVQNTRTVRDTRYQAVRNSRLIWKNESAILNGFLDFSPTRCSVCSQLSSPLSVQPLLMAMRIGRT